MDQLEYWNGPAAQRWVEYADALDRGVAGITRALMEAADARPGERVLDVGCGSGATSRTLAERVAPGGAVEGVDISAPLLAVARARVGDLPLCFTEADASTYEVRVPVDLVASRFGVMFFPDPAAAFDNLRRALAPGGRMVFVCWRDARDNHWATVPVGAARDLLPPEPPGDPHAPGPFAFAEEARLRGLLASAGFTRIDIAPHDDVMSLGATLAAAAQQALGLGPLARMATGLPDAVREQIRDRLLAAFAPYATADGVLMPAAVWLVQAR